MKRLLVFILALLASVATVPAAALAAAPDYQVAGGWFFSQTGGGTGKGFNLLDSGLDGRGQTIRFYSEFKRLGGVPVLGYPASGTYSGSDGFAYQATQAALMQWRPELNQVVLANVFDQLSQSGHDKDLLTLGIPSPISDDGSGGDFSKAVTTRLGWMTNPLIKARYLANPNPSMLSSWNSANSMELYGLPTSLPQRFGPFLVQRFQRVAFQLWLDNVPGQPPAGSVVPILGGDLAKRFGIVPSAAQAPQTAGTASPGAGLAVQAMPSLQPAVDLLIQYDQAHNTSYMKNLVDHHVAVVVSSVDVPGELGYYSPDDNTIHVSDQELAEDVHDVADLVAHESSHAYDYWTGVDITSTEGCYKTEVTAFKHQADVWLWFYPQLKPAPLDKLDSFLNRISQDVLNNPAAFVQQLEQVYHHQCAGN